MICFFSQSESLVLHIFLTNNLIEQGEMNLQLQDAKRMMLKICLQSVAETLRRSTQHISASLKAEIFSNPLEFQDLKNDRLTFSYLEHRLVCTHYIHSHENC